MFTRTNGLPSTDKRRILPKSLGALLTIVLLGSVAASCGDQSMTVIDGPGGDGGPHSLKAADGNGQVGTVGTVLPKPLSARVVTSDGRAVEGATITWTFAKGSGAEAKDGQTSETVTSLTDKFGLASVYWRLDTIAGDQEATAALAPGTNGAPSSKAKFKSQGKPAAPDSIVLSPASATISVGQPLQLRPTVLDKWGNVIAGAPVTWSSSRNNVASVNSSGTVTAKASGKTTIDAKSDKADGYSAITVSASNFSNVADITVDLQSTTLTALGATTQLSATATDGAGATIQGVEFTWTVLNTVVASVDSTGLVMAEKNGATSVVVSAPGTSAADTVAVTVSQQPASIAISPDSLNLTVGGTAQLTATVLDANHNAISGATVSWSSSDTSVATVDTTGMVTAKDSGAATIMASTDASTATPNTGSTGPSAVSSVISTASVSVKTGTSSAKVAKVMATPDTVTLTSIGQTVAIAATAEDSNAQVIDTVQFGFKSSDTGVATVGTKGRITAKAAGTALVAVTALCCGNTDTVQVTVNPLPDQITVSPSTASLEVGSTVTLSASVLDALGTSVQGVSVTWNSANKAIASVAGNGTSAVVTGVAEGSTNISAVASKDGKQVTTTVSTQVTTTSSGSTTLVNECSSPGSGWIWCDDFDQNRLSSYFEYDDASGSFTRVTTAGVGGSGGMRARFSTGQQDAGSLKLAFGQTPSSYMAPVDGGTVKYRDVYWRFYVRNDANWISGAGDGGDKLTRAMIFAKSDWSQAMIAHLWSGGSGSNYLMMDPASGTDTQGNLQTSGYNDFTNLRWLGSSTGQTSLYDSGHVGQWYCVEAHVRLNDSGSSNGIYEFWVDGNLEARETNLNWVGSYSQYGINSIFLENYWNNGAPQAQTRDLDNFVVSTQPIGCGGTTPPPPPPTSTVAAVSVSPTSVALTAPDGTRQLSATAYDSNGNVVSGVSFDWTSSDSGVADVSSSGLVYARAAGTAVITAVATCCSVTGSTSVTVQAQTTTGGGSPDLVEDFSTYTSTSNMLSDPRGIYTQNEDESPGQIALDATEAYGSNSKSMRFDYQASSATKNSETVGRNLSFARAQSEVWVEIYAMFSSNFTTVPTWISQILPYNPDFKMVFGRMSSGSGRFEFKEGNSTNTELSAGYPGNQEAYLGDFSMNSKSLWDGKWHRYRFHWKVGSGNGVVQVWIDDSLEINHSNLTMSKGSDTIYGLALGRNLDPAASQLQHLWWGSVKVWYGGNNPGW